MTFTDKNFMALFKKNKIYGFIQIKINLYDICPLL